MRKRKGKASASPGIDQQRYAVARENRRARMAEVSAAGREIGKIDCRLLRSS